MNKSVKNRLWATALIFSLDLLLIALYGFVRPLVDTNAALNQVNGGGSAFVWGNILFAILPSFLVMSGVVVILIWVTFFANYFTCFVALSFLLVGCGPARYDKFVEILANETAFVIPLQGDTSAQQKTFNSASYLETRKIAAKRIPVPLIEKSTGRMWYDYEWIDSIRVIKVNRSLVSREWTNKDGTGTSAKEEGIPVVTKDGIQLSLGVAITVFIEEDDASTYLYYHGEQELAKVTDVNIRNFCITELSREYGKLDLTDAKTKGPEIFGKLFEDSKAYFKTKGISVQQVGNAEGYTFANPAIQESINKRFTAEQDIATASQEKLAQDKRNEKLLATAKTTADAARMIYEAKEATALQNQLEIATMQAKAALTMAEKWDGKLPTSILPSDSRLLLNLGAK